MSDLAVIPDFDQRWRARREYRRTPQDRFSPGEFAVDVIGDRVAKPFVAEHHYSGSYPAAHVAMGLFRGRELAGVAVFSEGVQSTLAMPRWAGLRREEGTELGRFVLLPEVGYNGETWFLSRALTLLRQAKPAVRVVLSYADPVERRDASGAMVKPGHFGTIYQAGNALHAGRASGRLLHVTASGRVLHPYNFDKVRHQRRNWQAAERILAQETGECRQFGEEPDAYVCRIKAGLATLRHPGNLVYLFGLDRAEKKRLEILHSGGRPYPKARAAA